MQNNTKRKKKIAPIVIAVIVCLYMAPIVFFMLAAFWGLIKEENTFAVLPILLLYAAVGLAVIGGILYAMHQRLKEIDSGEEEEACKY